MLKLPGGGGGSGAPISVCMYHVPTHHNFLVKGIRAYPDYVNGIRSQNSGSEIVFDMGNPLSPINSGELCTMYPL